MSQESMEALRGESSTTKPSDREKEIANHVLKVLKVFRVLKDKPTPAREKALAQGIEINEEN
jgi:hypothetical protein